MDVEDDDASRKPTGTETVIERVEKLHRIRIHGLVRFLKRRGFDLDNDPDPLVPLLLTSSKTITTKDLLSESLLTEGNEWERLAPEDKKTRAATIAFYEAAISVMPPDFTNMIKSVSKAVGSLDDILREMVRLYRPFEESLSDLTVSKAAGVLAGRVRKDRQVTKDDAVLWDRNRRMAEKLRLALEHLRVAQDFLLEVESVSFHCVLSAEQLADMYTTEHRTLITRMETVLRKAEFTWREIADMLDDMSGETMKRRADHARDRVRTSEAPREDPVGPEK